MRSVPVFVTPLILLAAVPLDVSAQEIFRAARNGDSVLVSELLAGDPTLVHSTDERERTPLHHAARGGSIGVARLLLILGADVNAQDHAGQAPLHAAALRGYQEMTRFLLEHGADVEIRESYGRTALLLVARESGSVEMATLLLDAGADVDGRDRFGATSLNLAAWRGFSGQVDLFIERGATVPATGREGRTLTTFAAEKGLVTLFNVLVDGGADLTIRNDNGGSLLHAASNGGSRELVELLLGHGMEVNERDRYGRTPLHYAAERGRTEVVELLIQRGADVQPSSLAGYTPLNAAQVYERSEMVEQLVDAGASRTPPAFPQLDGPYMGQATPGLEPEVFALDIISSHRFEHGTVAFSPDGTEAFWSSSYEPSDSGYSWGRILESRLDGSSWTEPQLATFSTDLFAGDDIPFFSASGERLFFVSGRAHPADGSRAERIWYVDRADGGWSEPVVIDGGPNSMGHHWQFSVTANGDIYFASGDPGGHGGGDIYVSRLVGGEYRAPENVGGGVNGEYSEGSPFIAPDESYLIFMRNGQDDGFGGVDLYVSYEDGAGNWTTAVNMGEPINSASNEICPMVSPDGRYFFFNSFRSGNADNYWLDADVIQDLRHPR